MQSNNLKKFEDDLDFFDFTVIYWHNKWLVIAVFTISAFIGVVFYYSSSFLSSSLSSASESTTTSINILVNESLIEEVNSRINANVTYDPKNTIVIRLNRLLKSSFNYENWSGNNKNLSEYLSQGMTLSIFVVHEAHVVNINSDSKKNLEAIISYLKYTSKLISKNERQRLTNQIKMIENELYKQNKAYSDKLLLIQEELNYKISTINDEISTRAIQLEGARRELDVFAVDIPKETQGTSLLTLRMLDLTSTIQMQELMIEDLKTRKEFYIESFTTRMDYYGNLIKTLEFDSADELFKLNSLKDDTHIVSVGNILSTKRAFFYPNKLFIFLISITIGLLLSLFSVMFKVEYLKHKSRREIP